MRRGRPLEIIWRDEAAELYTRYRREKNAHRRDRLHVLWLIRTGKTLTEAGQLVGVSYSTIKRWVAEYRKGGLAEVLQRIPGHGKGGVRCYLTADQQAEVRAEADRGAFRTAQEAQQWIARRWGIAYRRKGIYALFERLNITWKVPRRQSDRADLQAQEAWKKGG